MNDRPSTSRTVAHVGLLRGANVGGRFVFPRCSLCEARACCKVHERDGRGLVETWNACHPCARDAATE